ncbi:MAG: aldo/keto reductase [Selenomonas sp.]|nr:aldo/keto reductase [Selenomonas sp.]
MDYIKLGNSDLQVSRICLGCMGFGNAATGQHSWTVDESATRDIIKHALQAGINFFDTAIAYQNGTSEEYLGRALKDYAKRDNVVVATKFLPRSQQEIAAGVTGQEHIARQLDLSLQHLGMDYVDLYIYHMWDYQTPVYDILDGLNRQVKAGKVRYIGIANCYAYQLAKAAELKLSAEDIAYLEELYIPHKLVGVMAQNTQDGNKKEQVWMKNAPQGMQ